MSSSSQTSSGETTSPRKRLRTVAVILAGGVGMRLGPTVPKQLLRVAGKPIIEHTLRVFEGSSEIDDVIVMMTTGYIEAVEAIVAENDLRKVSAILEGGATRNETTRLALDALGGAECNVLIHDAVRPLISARILRECVNALRTFEVVDVAIPSADTIVVVKDDQIVDIPDRASLRRGQTPQGFRLSTIRRAYELAWQDPDFAATDDCGVVLRYSPEVPIHVVEGSEQNMKVTAPLDLFIADKLFQLSSSTVEPLPNATAYAEELRGRVAVVFGGSYGIGQDIVAVLEGYGATVFSFSRSSTNTHVENAADVREALARAHEAEGRIDYIIVTAGVLHTGPLAESDDATVEEMIGVNYRGPVQVARLGVDYLQQTKGQLLLFTSSSYTRGRSGYSLYSSSKAAVVNLTQALAEEWSGLDVRVNCINPERTATPMRTRAFGVEAPEDLLPSQDVARTSVDVLIASMTGAVIDVRRTAPPPGLGDTLAGAEAVVNQLEEAEREDLVVEIEAARRREA